MTSAFDRRTFLSTSLAAGALAGVEAHASQASEGTLELYELRIYRTATLDGRDEMGRYLEKALIPALHRQGEIRCGAFTAVDEKDTSLYALLAFPDAESFFGHRALLQQDEAYLEAASEYYGHSKDDPAYARIESRLMRAFRSIPQLEQPVSQAVAGRVFELRIYESHNEEMARRKVEMFDEGETQLMRDVELGPVFFGETLISNDVPNLSYMLVAESEEAHKEHWKRFLASPEWDRMKRLDRYKDTVSKITSILLKPGFGSDL